jgi:hypothetical protein
MKRNQKGEARTRTTTVIGWLVMANRSLESKLRDAMRFIDKGIKERPKTKHPPRKSSMEQRLMAANKALKRM